MTNNLLYLNNYQLNELSIGTLIFCILFVGYLFLTKSLSIFDVIYTTMAFALTYFIANLGYNFVIYYI